MKKRLPFLCILLICMVIYSSSAETKVMVISDPHYLADTLYRKDNPILLSVLKNADGKLTQYSNELLDALVAEAFHQQPDALIITGDLTFNGEEESHRQLAGYLDIIRSGGIPVYVIPGNHDINTREPVGFSETGLFAVNSIDEQRFMEIYRDFLLPPEGASGANMSYCIKVDDRLWIAMVDVSCYQDMAYTNGIFTKDHADWLEGVLEEARQSGITVITASHHSLFVHSEYQKEFYVMGGSEKLLELKKRFDSRLHLSGHLHIQHIVTDGPIADAAIGAFCLYPHYCAMVTLEDDEALSYTVQPLCDEHLPEGFMAMSRTWFTELAKGKRLKSLIDSGLSADEITAMLDFASRFNLSYFSGVYGTESDWTDDPAYKLWLENGSTFAEYVRTVMGEPQSNHLSLRLE